MRSAMTRPLLTVEQRLVDAGAFERMQAEVRRLVAQQAAENSRRTAARSAGGDNAHADLEAALAAAQFADSIAIPPVPRLIADDITPRSSSFVACRAGRSARDHFRRGRHLRHHRRPLQRQRPQPRPVAQGHSGDPLRVDRKGRSPEHIPTPALSLGLMIQPSVLSTIAANAQFRGRGLLARFLYSQPPSRWGAET